jgi:transposase
LVCRTYEFLDDSLENSLYTSVLTPLVDSHVRNRTCSREIPNRRSKSPVNSFHEKADPCHYDGQAKIAFLPLPPHTSLRRSALQALYRHMDQEIEKLTVQVAEQAEQRSGTQLLMTHPGVGPVTALATDVFLGDPQRFDDGKSLASYVGLIPQERSSGRRRRLGKIGKQGNPLLRFLWNEAGAHAAIRS